MPTWGSILGDIRTLQNQGVENPFDKVRRFYLQELSKQTGRETILYSTAMTHPGGSSGLSIDDRDVHAFMEVVHSLDGDKLDIILHSPGGSAESTEQIVSYLRKKFDEIRIFVPQAAMSAATLMCCAADKVFMAKHSAIGPIDPQFATQTPFGMRITAAQAILDQFTMAQNSINNQRDLVAWQPLLNQYSVGLLAECQEAMALSRDLAHEWSQDYMHADKPDDRAKELADELSSFLANRKQFKSHGRRIDAETAAAHGLDVEVLESDQDLQDSILSVFHAAMHTHSGRPIMKIIENQKGSAVIKRSEGTISTTPPTTSDDDADDSGDGDTAEDTGEHEGNGADDESEE